jgi:hypothetical protein
MVQSEPLHILVANHGLSNWQLLNLKDPWIIFKTWQPLALTKKGVEACTDGCTLEVLKVSWF